MKLKIPPLAQGAAALLLIWLLDRYIPVYRFDFRYQNMLAAAISLPGLFIAAAGIIAFRQSKTTVDPRRPEKASALVVQGVYKFTRNPMYLGLLLAIIGFALYLGALPGVIVAPVLFVLFINRFQIAPEESALSKKFGQDYIKYCTKVRRWL